MPAKSAYNVDTLNEFCLQNEITLLHNYEEVNRDTKIEGYCKTPNCNGTYKKAFRMLNEHKNFYCQSCLKLIKNNKMKKTCLEKYGHVTNLLLEEIKTKSHSQEALNKRKQTNLIKYGFECPSKNKLVRQKMNETTYKRFGVYHALQNEVVAENITKKMYNIKEFITCSGKIFTYQGYENFALEYLLYCLNIDENKIITRKSEVPVIWYTDQTNKKHRHYVDIFIPTENLCIEVKSSWTAKKKQDNIFLKQNAAKKLGYKYEIWIYDCYGNCIEHYD